MTMVGQASAAQLYSFTISSPGGDLATGFILESGGQAVSGTMNVIAGIEAPALMNLVPGSGLGPSGAFTYDNTIFPGSDPQINVVGLLFQDPGTLAEINIWANGPGDYSYYSWHPSFGYRAQWANGAHFLMVPVPEPSSVAAISVGALALVRRRFKKN